MIDWGAIARHIGAVTGEAFEPRERQSIGGGCINAAALVTDGARSYFVKSNHASRLDLFEAETDGLSALGAAGVIRVPEPLCWGCAGAASYLVLEGHDLTGGPGRGREAGRALAALHRRGGPGFGWHRDNYIGSTPQPNPQTADWTAFWREHRLGHQLELAARNGYGRDLQPQGDRLLAGLDALLAHRPGPSLLHGDLWAGNLAYLGDGTPMIFDPAVYLGDREADLAMTELFGGFGEDFYAAYRESWPIDPGYGVRKGLYNLYHVLNHLNLFGSGYLGQARSLIGRLLAELG